MQSQIVKNIMTPPKRQKNLAVPVERKHVCASVVCLYVYASTLCVGLNARVLVRALCEGSVSAEPQQCSSPSVLPS